VNLFFGKFERSIPMRLRGSLFWGIVLILLAAFLLARQMGILGGDVTSYFLPALAILFGIWLLIGAASRGQRQVEGQTVSIPLENARSARIKFDHGAGRLNVRSGTSPTELLSGVFGTEIDVHSRLQGDQLEIRLRNAPHFWMWYPGQNLDWDISLNRDVPVSLDIDSGASSTILDLTDLKVTNLDINTGASSTEVNLPANAGNTRVDIDTGASAVKIRVPAGVAASIRIKSGVSSKNVDTARFPHIDGGLYQSAEYSTAANRADINIESGVGSIEIR
jgi:hypothetical protein